MTARGEAPTYLYLHATTTTLYIAFSRLPTHNPVTHTPTLPRFVFLVIIPTCTIFFLTTDGRNLPQERTARQFHKMWMIFYKNVTERIVSWKMYVYYALNFSCGRLKIFWRGYFWPCEASYAYFWITPTGSFYSFIPSTNLKWIGSINSLIIVLVPTFIIELSSILKHPTQKQLKMDVSFQLVMLASMCWGCVGRSQTADSRTLSNLDEHKSSQCFAHV